MYEFFLPGIPGERSLLAGVEVKVHGTTPGTLWELENGSTIQRHSANRNKIPSLFRAHRSCCMTAFASISN
jgi:hypothetical protein